jgi:hypothetical protein
MVDVTKKGGAEGCCYQQKLQPYNTKQKEIIEFIHYLLSLSSVPSTEQGGKECPRCNQKDYKAQNL